MSEIKQVAVIGAGTMGHGIAQVFAQAGFDVALADTSFSFAEAGLSRIVKNLARLTEKKIITPEDQEKIAKRISPTENLKDLKEAQLVVEAVVESLEAKTKLFRELDSICHPSAIFTSNTSSLPITQLAASTKRPPKFAGMHFMNPVPVMKLVEVVRGRLTSDETVKTIHALSAKLGKTSVEANDYPGFISNRILMPMINEAIFAYMEGVGTREAIDSVMKLGMNHPMGPLELADFIGLDVCLAILDVLFDGFKDPKYRPCPLLVKMVQAGELGRKTKSGFYMYGDRSH